MEDADVDMSWLDDWLAIEEEYASTLSETVIISESTQVEFDNGEYFEQDDASTLLILESADFGISLNELMNYIYALEYWSSIEEFYNMLYSIEELKLWRTNFADSVEPSEEVCMLDVSTPITGDVLVGNISWTYIIYGHQNDVWYDIDASANGFIKHYVGKFTDLFRYGYYLYNKESDEREAEAYRLGLIKDDRLDIPVEDYYSAHGEYPSGYNEDGDLIADESDDHNYEPVKQRLDDVIDLNYFNFENIVLSGIWETMVIEDQLLPTLESDSSYNDYEIVPDDWWRRYDEKGHDTTEFF